MAVDQIVANNPGRVAAIEWHVNSGYPLYLAEARQRWYSYPPPYYQGGNWYYATPWAWIDGKSRGYQYSTWNSWVNQRLSEPADIGINLAGDYLPGNGTGELVIELVNPTAAEVTGNLLVIVTEDSIYQPVPNGDQWHNHVCREFVTGIAGTPVSIPAMTTDTVAQPFTIRTGWVERNCHLVAFLQSPTQQADSSRPVLQAGTIRLLELTGIKEAPRPARPRLGVASGPNPVRDRSELRFSAAPGARWELAVYSSNGRLVTKQAGAASGDERILWQARDETGTRLPAGVYGWRLAVAGERAQGKFVVVD